MPSPAQTSRRQQEEISIVDIWKIFLKRRALMFWSFIICIAGGAAYAFLKPPIYEVTAQLSIGQIQISSEKSPLPLEKPEELEYRLLSAFGKKVAEGVERERPFLTKAGPRKGGSTTLELTVEGDTPDDAKELLNNIVKSVLENHLDIYKGNIDPLSGRIHNLAAQREALQQQYEDVSALSKKISEHDPVQASLLMLERGPLTQSLDQQDAERLRLTQQTLAPQTRPSTVLGEITAPIDPSHPKKALVLAVAAVLGLMTSIMLAFTAEFFSRAREQSR